MLDSEWRGGVKHRMRTVEQGVANFREEQLEAREFRGWFRSQEEQRQKIDTRRSRIHFSLLAGLISLMVGLVLWAISFETRHKVVSDDRPAAVSSNHKADTAVW